MITLASTQKKSRKIANIQRDAEVNYYRVMRMGMEIPLCYDDLDLEESFVMNSHLYQPACPRACEKDEVRRQGQKSVLRRSQQIQHLL